MISRIFYGLVVAFGLFIAGGLLLSREVHVERSIDIERPVSTVFALVNGHRTFVEWSPWAGRDPATVYEFSGPVSGVGARLSWEGDPRLVGKGWQEITASRRNEWVGSRLEFDQQGRADSYFQLEETATGTRVTWGFDSDLVEGQGFFGGLLARYFGLFFDRWIGSDYEQGLANLKAYAEALPAADFSDLEVELLYAQPLDILYVSSASRQDPEDLADSLTAAYREISAFMNANDIEMQAQPMAITRAWDERGYRFDAAVPVRMSADLPLTGRLQFGQSPSGPAVRAVHHGPYETMSPTYEKLAGFMGAHGLAEGRVSWEHYISDPGETPAQDMVTHIYFLLGEETDQKP